VTRNASQDHTLHIAAVLAAALLAFVALFAVLPHRDASAIGPEGNVIYTTDTQVPGTSPQDATDGGQRMHVQLWTVLAAGGAACVGLLLFLARIAMGWVKPPPPPQEDAHH